MDKNYFKYMGVLVKIGEYKFFFQNCPIRTHLVNFNSLHLPVRTLPLRCVFNVFPKKEEGGWGQLEYPGDKTAETSLPLETDRIL